LLAEHTADEGTSVRMPSSKDGGQAYLSTGMHLGNVLAALFIQFGMDVNGGRPDQVLNGRQLSKPGGLEAAKARVGSSLLLIRLMDHAGSNKRVVSEYGQ